ncbi:hypothetical protein ACHQM5_023369 [Ranunculus cassubicifolius]
MSRRRKQKPSFISYMRSNFSKRLRIPPDFVKHFNHKVPELVTLKVSSGRCWTVRSKTADHKEYFLEKGWSEFVNENSIEYNDTLLFKLVGDAKLYVKIYGRCCCEKEKVHNKIKERVHNKIMEKVTKDIVSFESKRKSEKEDIIPKKMHCESTTTKNQNAQIVVKDEEGDNDCLGKQVVPHVPLNLRKKQGKMEFQERCQFKSDYPFFIYKLSNTAITKGFLTLPTRFAKDHFGEKTMSPTNVQFIDPEGRTWDVKYRNNSRPYIGEGWKKVVSANAFRDDYVCAFELVHLGDMKLKISVLDVGKYR